MNHNKEPLYRKVNTKARGVHHLHGSDYRHDRNTKEAKHSDIIRQPMHAKKQRGLDYTPLFKFLLSKIGGVWDEIFSEAVSRLDRPDPIFWMVALHEHERQDYFCIGESSYFSGLFVDEAGLLQLVNPDFGAEDITPLCGCCTYTFNGKPIPKRWSATQA